VNDKLAVVLRQISVSEKAREKLTIECDELLSFVFSKENKFIECDELLSFVFSKENKFYVWLTIDRKTREIVGYYIGNRSRESAKKLLVSLPPVYRQCAVAFTDFWVSYETVIPRKRHQAVGKETGQTHHVVRY
jgi:insertion element IS1 protein InsB